MSIKEIPTKVLKGDIKGAIHQTTEVVGYQLKRTIGLSGVIVISLSAMLGSGLFVLPSLAGGMMGAGIWLAYILAASVVLPGALSKSELASAMPTSGGSYVYIERTYGPFFGTITGLGLWASFMLKSAFALIGFAAYLEVISVLGDFDYNIQYVALSVLVLVVILNILGVKKVKAIQAPIVGVSVAMLLGLCIAAFFTVDVDLSRPVQSSAFKGGFVGLAETAAFVFVAYAGVTKVAAIAEEVKDPHRNLPHGMLISLGAATFLYAIVAFMLMATLPDQWWIGSDGHAIENPIFVFAEHVGGSTVGLIAAGLAILTMASMALAGVLAASRFIFAMARDNLLPQALEDVNAKYETPHWPIIITGLTMGIAILTLNVHDVAKLASGFKIMIFMVVNSCVVVLRKATPDHAWYDPTYLSPAFPYVQIWGIIAGVVLLVIMGEKAFIGAGAAVVIGIISYYSYGRKHCHIRTTPFVTFRAMMRNPTKVEHERRVVAFHAADRGGKNHLTLSEFQHAIQALGFQFTNDEIRVIFHRADRTADGVIDIDEFLAYVEGPELRESE